MTDQIVENIELQPRAMLLEQLQAAPEMMRRALGERSSADLRAPGSDGGMSVTEILCHLQDWEEITGERVWTILRQYQPDLEAYDDSLWSIEHGYADRDGWEVMEAFTTSRRALVEELAARGETDWQRSATLPKHGTISIAWLMDRVVKHDAKHIKQIVDALL